MTELKETVKNVIVGAGVIAAGVVIAELLLHTVSLYTYFQIVVCGLGLMLGFVVADLLGGFLRKPSKETYRNE